MARIGLSLKVGATLRFFTVLSLWFYAPKNLSYVILTAATNICIPVARGTNPYHRQFSLPHFTIRLLKQEPFPFWTDPHT